MIPTNSPFDRQDYPKPPTPGVSFQPIHKDRLKRLVGDAIVAIEREDYTQAIEILEDISKKVDVL